MWTSLQPGDSRHLNVERMLKVLSNYNASKIHFYFLTYMYSIFISSTNSNYLLSSFTYKICIYLLFSILNVNYGNICFWIAQYIRNQPFVSHDIFLLSILIKQFLILNVLIKVCLKLKSMPPREILFRSTYLNLFIKTHCSRYITITWLVWGRLLII